MVLRYESRRRYPLKYWRGYLVAAIFALCSWGLIEFAQSHWVLVDMVYPYVTRMIQTFLADWSAGVDFCLWQLILIVMGAAGLASVVMMVIWKWNPIQWFGWIVAAVSIVFFLNTAIYGLNDYAGTLADDLRLEVVDYTVSELEEAGAFYLEQANDLAGKIDRDGNGEPQFPAFQDMVVLAAKGFENQTYENFNPVFAGTTVPVKELGWSNILSRRGITGITVGLTGEACVNPQTPDLVMPFVICRQMAQRMCITNDQDADFAAFMACDANPMVEFRYSGYLMAYNHCYQSLKAMDTGAAQASAAKLAGMENSNVTRDLESYNASFAAKDEMLTVELPTDSEQDRERPGFADMLVSWYIQEYVLPLQVEEEVLFDPKDESQVDLSGIANAQ